MSRGRDTAQAHRRRRLPLSHTSGCRLRQHRTRPKHVVGVLLRQRRIPRPLGRHRTGIPVETPAPAMSPSTPCRKSGLCQRVPRSTKSRWPHCSGKGCTPTPSTSPTTPWAAEPNRPWPSKPPTWAADSPCAPAKPSFNGHWQWPTASTTPGSARSGIPPSTTTSGHRSEPPWRGSDSPTNTVASPPTTANCRASSPATPAPAPPRSPATT